jgi:transcriptional regulator with XRE-family HTH domain
MPINKRFVTTDMRIGERVLLARRRLALSQRDVAELVPMGPSALNRLERGLQSVSAETLARLARLLRVSSDYLLGLKDERGRPLKEEEEEEVSVA